jgi:hypothetical protein
MTRTSQTMLLCEALAAWAGTQVDGTWSARPAPSLDLEKLVGRVQVVWPFSREVVMQTRGRGKEIRPEFALAIAQRVPPLPADQVEQFDIELKRIEDLADAILGVSLGFGSRTATFMTSRHEPLFDRTFLEQHRVVACAVVVGAVVHTST